MIANIRQGAVAVAAAAALFFVVLLNWHLQDEPRQRLLAASDGADERRLAEPCRRLTFLPDPKSAEEEQSKRFPDPKSVEAKPCKESMLPRPLWVPLRPDVAAGIAPVPRYSTPLSVIAMRCSGSAALFQLMRKALIAHGTNIASYHFDVMLRPSKTRFWEKTMQKITSEGGVVPKTTEKWRNMHDSLQYDMAVLEMMNEVFTSDPESSVLFRAEPDHLIRNEYNVANGLKWMNTRFVYFYRSNSLDHLVCRVRDCGDKMSGQAVLASTGQPTELCSHENKTMAFLDTSTIVKRLYMKNNRMNNIIEALGPYMGESMAASGKVAFSEEDLNAFVYTMDEDVFLRSLDEWTKLLSFAVDVNKEILAGTMRQYQGRKQLRPHSDVIANLGEVIAALNNSGLEHYLRY